jgi:hypothetical protein
MSSILSNIFIIFANFLPTLITFFRKTSAIAVATLVRQPYNPRDPHSHPRLTGAEEVEGGLPKQAAHATSVTHEVTSPNDENMEGVGGGPPKKGVHAYPLPIWHSLA